MSLTSVTSLHPFTFLHAGSSPGSLGSSEQMVDSDSELDETGRGSTHCPHSLVKLESKVSTEDDQLSCKDSLKLSRPSLPQPVLVPDQESPGPDALNHDPPDLEECEQELSST